MACIAISDIVCVRISTLA
uniref:Uncharacterized protein n=1 Tax=Anguilla anguilla TaxID=7936 RepID=A0A0E9SLT2_ANGAN